MPSHDISQLLKNLTFATDGEAAAFHSEITALSADKATAFIVRNNTLDPLKQLFLLLRSDLSDFELSLMSLSAGNGKSGLLQGFFQDLGDFPPSTTAAETLIRLALRGLEKEILQKITYHKILDFYAFEQLQKLKYFYKDNSYVLVDFYERYGDTSNDADKLLILDLLHLLYPTSLSEDSATEIMDFFQNVAPHFEQRFSHRMEAAELRKHTDRLAEWFMVWRGHQARSEKELPVDSPYYEMDFSTIVKYVPEFIWWNNGLYYRNGDKNFHFGSLGFFHLAQGGSIRKSTDEHHYTRRMAKVFVGLPYDFDQTDKDMYVYCYGKSLGAGALLSEMLQQFFRHHEEAEELQKELDKWNPVIQKFACDEFEAFTERQARNLIGYVYHCLRDQADFSVQRRSVSSLLQDSDAYYARIEERARQRAIRAAAKEVKRQRNEWGPHKNIKPHSVGNHSIVELTNRRSLEHEGTVMKHCVGGYSQRCKAGHCSIWSLRELQDGAWYSRVTIEVDRSKYIRQASARFNARPNKEHWAIIKSWAGRNAIKTN